MLDETEFLSPLRRPRALAVPPRAPVRAARGRRRAPRATTSRRSRRPGSSAATRTGAGPIWFPVNYLLIESLQKFHHYYGDDFKVECPTGSGQLLTLWEVADELSRRLTRLFLRDARRPPARATATSSSSSTTRTGATYLLFYEYFHGDNGAGLGASHQTGWTGLVAKLIQQSGE